MNNRSTILYIDANEIWEPVIGFDRNYAVSNLGRLVYLEDAQRGWVRAGMEIKQHMHPLGYHYIATTVGHARKKPWVHVIVAAAFLGPRPDGYEVNHIDRNKSNNALSNLEYITHKQNLRHSYEDIYLSWTRPRKVTDVQIAEMTTLYRSGQYLQREIAAMYGISQCYVSVLIRAA